MKSLLIACYELGHQPFNLASPAAYLQDSGFEVVCLDLSVQKLDADLIRESDLIAISTPMHTALRLGLKAAKRIHEINPAAHLCFYGLYAGMHSEYLLNYEGGHVIDSVIGGEFEHALLDLARRVACRDLPNIEGVNTSEFDGGTSFRRQQFRVPKRDLLPPLSQYAHLAIGDQLLPVGYVEASRGCAHRCRHCPITPVYSGRVRIVPQDIVLADVAQLVELGAQHITFGDPDFLNGVKHSLSIVRRMHETYPHLTFDFTAKIEHLLEYRELLPEFKELGCVFIVSAVELLNNEALAILDKGHTKQDVAEALALTRDAGITLRPSLMPFTPWTTFEDYVELLQFITESGIEDQIDPVQLSIRLLVPPNSTLLKQSDIWDHITDFNEAAFAYEWRHPDPEMDALQREVGEIVENAVKEGTEQLAIMNQVRQRVFAHTDRLDEVNFDYRKTLKSRAPRLTENWFC